MKVSILSGDRKGSLPDVDTICTPETPKVKRTMTCPTLPVTTLTKPTPKGGPIIPPLQTIAKSPDSRPMESSTYLGSPLDTILESIYGHDLDHISLHDLIEAYNVISSRIRSQARVILQDGQTLTALASLKEHSSSLAYALKRDIQRALVHPLYNSHNTPVSGGSPSTDATMTDGEIQYARDLATLSLHALRFLSNIFTFTSLHSLFTMNDLCDLLGDILKIASEARLPTPNPHKTWTLVVWIIQVQNLPSTVLSVKKDEISKVLVSSIDGKRGYQAKLDGLKAINTILTRHAELFIAPLSKLFPLVLRQLASESIDCRLHAAHALNGFALAKLKMLSSTEYPHQHISHTVRSFVESQSSRRRSPDALCLSNIFAEALSVVDSPPADARPSWAVIVIASLIVLIDSALFFHPRSLKMSISSLAYAAKHKRSSIRTLHAYAWRALVWAFSRISVESDGSDLENGGFDTVNSVKERAFLVVKQELKGGIGIALTAALLGSSGTDTSLPQAPDNVSKALIIVREMVSGERNSSPHDGLLLLDRLVGAVGIASNKAEVHDDESYCNFILPQQLFDGTILNTSPNRLADAVRLIDALNANRVRQLSEVELVHHWDALLATWIDGIERTLQGSTFALSLLHIWQSLLLVQGQLTKSYCNFTASSTFAGRVASILAQFLVQLEESEAQVRRLTLVRKLWAVMKNIFSSSWLPPPAEIILAALLKQKFSLDNEAVKTAWHQLCADLISVGIPTVLHIVSTSSERKDDLEVTRQLWAVIAKVWRDLDDTILWEDLLVVLAVPFEIWVMSDGELDLWDGTLRRAISIAGTMSLRPTQVIGRLLQRMSAEKMKALTRFPKGAALLLSYIDLSDVNSLPSEIFLMVDATLFVLYPPPPELLSTSLEILHLLGDIVASTPGSLLVQFISTVQNSLCCWIGDEARVMHENEHNSVVSRVYCRALDILRHQEPSLETLNALSPFFASAFLRLTESAVGPLAFESFWRGTYHHLDHCKASCPVSIKACLLGLSDAYGGSLGDGLSLSSESQRTPTSVVPDSQPSYRGKGEFEFRGHDTGQSQYPLSDDAIEIRSRTSHLAPQTSNHQPSIASHEIRVPGPIPDRNDGERRRDHMAALRQLEDYHSQMHEEISRSKCSSAARDFTESYPLHQRKRSASDTGDERAPKRQKAAQRTHSEPDVMPRVWASKADPSARPRQRVTVSGSMIRAASEGASQDTSSRKREMVLDWIEAPTYREAPQLRNESQSSVLPPSRLHISHSEPSSEDYDSWEAGVSMEEMRRLQHELAGSDFPVPPSDMDENTEIGGGGTEPDSDLHGLGLFLNSSSGTRAGCKTRAKTAPGSLVVRSQPHPPALRRNKTTSVRMDALQRAYAAVAEDASQLPVEELVHATRLVNQIGTALNEQIGKKLAQP